MVLKTFVGGELRLSWQSLPPPKKEGSPPPSQSPVDPQEKGAPPPLVNSSDSEEGPVAGVSGYGRLPSPTKFGLPARRQVKRLSTVLDGLADRPEDTIFFTGTLPGSTRASMLALSQWSGYLVHRLKAWIHDVDPDYSCVYCWEWQRRGALHLHMSVYVKENDKRNTIYNGLRTQYLWLLERICELSGVDVFKRSGGRGTWRNRLDKVRATAEWVRKSISAYLGKYMSKASAPGLDASRYFYPSRWWGSTQNLKDLEKEARTESVLYVPRSGDAEAVYLSMGPLVELLSEWSTEYRHKVMPGSTQVAMSADTKKLTEIFRSENGMRSMSKTPGWVEAVNEFQALLRAMEQKRPDWMLGFRNECPSYDRLCKVQEGLGGDGWCNANDYACTIMACAHQLNSDATGQVWHGRYPLSYWGVKAVRDRTDRVMVEFNLMDRVELLIALEMIEMPARVRAEIENLPEQR